jgi:phosphoglycolate phosphatase-like HAD superfamily hydrolase
MGTGTGRKRGKTIWRVELTVLRRPVSFSDMTKEQKEATAAVTKAFNKLYREHDKKPAWHTKAYDAYNDWLLALHARALAFPKGKPTPFEAQAYEAFWKDKHFVFDVVIVYSMDEVDRTIPNSNLIERLGDFIEEIPTLF